MNLRAKKILLLVLAAALLVGSGQMQKVLNRDRDQLGLTRMSALDNAPPVLAFTTVALGGFRGLIANALWIRANDLQQDDKFFEAAQLANWITDLEPHFAQVWAFQSWNMAWNISVKFKENAPGNYSDRWRWVENGIELLRDHGLRYNPDDTLLYQQLGWIFQSKLGQNLDDANIYYKSEWAREMTPFFGAHGTNLENLIYPQTPEEKTNALVFREKYKIDPAFAQTVDAQYGPLDWRLPEAHAIYWGARGLDVAKKNPDKVKADDLITLRRLIYQSLLQEVHHGRIIENPFSKTYASGPNLDLIPQLNATFEELYVEETEPGMKDGIQRAHRNALRDAVYFLYEANRMAEAGKWFKYLGEKYPDKPVIENDPNSLPKNLTLDEYAVAVVRIDIGETSQERVTAAIQGFLIQSYSALATGQDDRYVGFKLLARNVYDHYVTGTAGSGNNQERVKLPPFDVLNRAVLDYLLDTQKPVLPYAARAIIRTQLIMPPETNAPPAVTISTNAIAPAVLSGTNAPATNSIGK